MYSPSRLKLLHINNIINILTIFIFLYFVLFNISEAADNTNDDPSDINPSQLTRQSQTTIININGKISKLLLERIKKTTQRLNTDNRFPPSLVVTLDSLGGDGEAAIEIGKILRTYNAHVFVTNRCGSACVFIYAGGSFRSSIPLSIGIHQPRVTISDNGARIIKELDLNKNELAQNMLSNFDSKANEYFNNMGISNGFYERVQSQKTKELYWLDEKEIDKFELNGLTNDTLNAMVADLNANSRNNLDKNKVVMNSKSVLKECLYFKNEPHNFLKCYIKVMSSN